MTTTSEPIPAEVRRERMLELVQEQDFVRIAALAEAFAVSVVTVRGDLDLLESQGLIRRVRGGARAMPQGAAAEPSSRGIDEVAREALVDARPREETSVTVSCCAATDILCVLSRRGSRSANRNKGKREMRPKAKAIQLIRGEPTRTAPVTTAVSVG